MKTIELVKKLESIEGIKVFQRDFVSALNSQSMPLGRVGTIGSWLEIFNDCPDEVAKTLFEYHLTPLEEREEEKKYYLRLPSNFNSILGENYVCLTTDTKQERYIVSSKNELFRFRTKFTQKEIDAMPFDTNFFIKEEVL